MSVEQVKTGSLSGSIPDLGSEKNQVLGGPLGIRLLYFTKSMYYALAIPGEANTDCSRIN